MKFLILPILIIFNLYANDLKEEQTINKKDSYIDSISIGIGKINSNNSQRVSIQKNFNKNIVLSDSLQLNGYFDFAMSKFNFKEKNIYTFSISPVFKYNFNTINNFTPYIFAGIGASYLSNTQADGKNFSTNLQFEDRLGIGIKKEKIDFQLGYFHYSNASIKKPNDGI